MLIVAPTLCEFFSSGEEYYSQFILKENILSLHVIFNHCIPQTVATGNIKIRFIVLDI
jgi:hypothetical protein